MRGAGRAGAILTAFALVLAAGCSGGGASPRSMASEESLDAIAGRVTDMVSDNGIPIENDYIRCTASLDGQSAECHGQTASEPAKDIKATFSPSSPTSGQPGCPGTLRVAVGPPISDFDVIGPVTALQSRQMDPCR